MALYPLGYSGPWVEYPHPYQTATTVAKLDPRVLERIARMMEYARLQGGIPLGIGTGWRVQPRNKPGFAPPGQSYHEGWINGTAAVPDGVHDTGAMAADMVPSSSWPWMDAQCERFGLISFQYVNGEPWHVQPAEIPRARARGHPPPPLDNFVLPPPLEGHGPPPPPPPTTTARSTKMILVFQWAGQPDAWYVTDGVQYRRIWSFDAINLLYLWQSRLGYPDDMRKAHVLNDQQIHTVGMPAPGQNPGPWAQPPAG